MSGEDHDGNPFETPGAQQMAAWTLRLAHTSGLGWLLTTDPHLFGLLYASCAAAVLEEELTPEAWIEQLLAEAKAKMAGLRRQQLGFAAR